MRPLASIGALLVLGGPAVPDQGPRAYHDCESFGHPLFGSVVCAAGDEDGDGVPDLIVADPCWKGNGGTARAWLVSGKTMRVLFERAIEGCSEDTELAIQGVEDANGDGTRDWLLSPAWRGAQTDARWVVVSGKSGEILGERAAGILPEKPAGPPRADLGDLDGDSVHDWAIRDRERVLLRSGKEDKLLRRIEPPIAEAWSDFGASLAALGDIDGDKLCDLAIGSPEWGVAEGRVQYFSSATGKRLCTVEADKAGWHWGRRLVALGDLDGDGISELAIASWHALSHEPGRARIVSGKDGRSLVTFLRNGNELVIQRRSCAGPPR